MPINADIEFPQADVDAMFAQMRRAQKELGKSSKESLKWAGSLLITSLAASTKSTPKSKKRELIDNPHPMAQTDHRRAKIGVMKWLKNKQVFVPIYRVGEYGGGRIWGEDRIMSKSDSRAIMHKKREIPRKGFAKRSWYMLRKVFGRGGEIYIDGVPRIGSIRWTGGETDPTVKILNKVKYMDKALKGGKSAIDTAMGRASQNLLGRINRLVEKQRWTK